MPVCRIAVVQIAAKLRQLLPRLAKHSPGVLDDRPIKLCDIQDVLPKIAPIEPIFPGLIFEYVDLREAMDILRKLCALGEALVAVLQSPSA
jgi:hypothetical protein